MCVEELLLMLREMECRPIKRYFRQVTTKSMERFQLRVLAGVHCRFLVKKVLDKLLLGSLRLVDKSLGAIYFILDVGFEGIEASKAKNILLTENFPSSCSSSSSSSSSFSSFSSSSSSSSTSASSSSTPRSSNDFGVEGIDLLSSFNSNDNHQLPIEGSPAPGGNQPKISKPRRAGIIAERKNARKCSEGCTCWGWQVEEQPLDDEQFPGHDTLQELPLHDDDDDDDEYNNVGSSATDDVKVRWSECQCPDCRKLWMPMSKARTRLHVQKWDTNNNSSDVEHSRNTRKSPSEFELGISKDSQSREPKVDDRNLRSSGRSTSSTVGGDAGHSNRNFLMDAKSLRRSCVNSAGTTVTEKRERETTGVIFLHGIFSSSDFWFDSNVIPMLDGEIKARHMILAPDLLGCGKSPRPHDSVYTLSDQVDALENSLLRKHALESYHIVAHSMGTVPALALAARYPHRVRSLTLIAPVYAGYTDPKRKGGDEILTDCNSILAWQDPWSMRAIRSLTASEYYNINRCFGHLLFSRHRLLVPIFQRLLQNRWPRSFVRDYLTVTHDAAWHIVHNTMIGGSHALVPALRKLRDRGMRVFVIHGTEDTSCPFKQSVLMTQHFDNVVLDSVPGKGHVNVVLGRDDEVLPVLEDEIRLGDRNFPKSSLGCKLS